MINKFIGMEGIGVKSILGSHAASFRCRQHIPNGGRKIEYHSQGPSWGTKWKYKMKYVHVETSYRASDRASQAHWEDRNGIWRESRTQGCSLKCPSSGCGYRGRAATDVALSEPKGEACLECLLADPLVGVILGYNCISRVVVAGYWLCWGCWLTPLVSR